MKSGQDDSEKDLDQNEDEDDEDEDQDQDQDQDQDIVPFQKSLSELSHKINEEDLGKCIIMESFVISSHNPSSLTFK